MGKLVGGGLTAFEAVIGRIDEDVERLGEALMDGSTIVAEDMRHLQGQIRGLKAARLHIEEIAKQYEEQ
jgi:hypothetical protein